MGFTGVITLLMGVITPFITASGAHLVWNERDLIRSLYFEISSHLVITFGAQQIMEKWRGLSPKDMGYYNP